MTVEGGTGFATRYVLELPGTVPLPTGTELVTTRTINKNNIDSEFSMEANAINVYRVALRQQLAMDSILVYFQPQAPTSEEIAPKCSVGHPIHNQL